MKMSFKFRLLSLLIVLSTLSFSFRPNNRDIAQVKSMLIGEWKVVDMVVEPGRPFPGTIEEEQLLKEITKSVLDNSASTLFIFYANQQFEVSLPNMNANKKVKATWDIIQEGDVLVVKSKKAKETILKILIIDEENLELFSDTDEERILYVFKKN